MNRRTKIFNWTCRQGRKLSAIPALAVVSVGDFFIPALPTQSSVMLLGLLQPKRILLIALAFAAAAAAGSGLIALLSQLVAGYLGELTPQPGSAGYETFYQWQTLIQQHGLMFLFLLCFLPTPPRITVALALLSGLSGLSVMLTVFTGKLIWFLIILVILRQAPDILSRMPLIGPRITQLRQAAKPA